MSFIPVYLQFRSRCNTLDLIINKLTMKHTSQEIITVNKSVFAPSCQSNLKWGRVWYHRKRCYRLFLAYIVPPVSSRKKHKFHEDKPWTQRSCIQSPDKALIPGNGCNDAIAIWQKIRINFYCNQIITDSKYRNCTLHIWFVLFRVSRAVLTLLTARCFDLSNCLLRDDPVSCLRVEDGSVNL